MSFDTDTGNRSDGRGSPSLAFRRAETDPALLRTGSYRRGPKLCINWTPGVVKGVVFYEGLYAGGIKGLLNANDADATIPRWVDPPASATSPGVAGQMAYDGTYLYVCRATNVWWRFLGTWV